MAGEEKPKEMLMCEEQLLVCGCREREKKSTGDLPGVIEAKSQRWHIGRRELAGYGQSVGVFDKALVSEERIRKRFPREVHCLTEKMQMVISRTDSRKED